MLNAAEAMRELLGKPLPLSDWTVSCGTRLTRSWTRDGFDGYAPAMGGHLVSTYHGGAQDATWRRGRVGLAARLRPGTVTLVPDGHDGLWTLAGPLSVSHVYLSVARLQACADVLAGGRQIELLDRLGMADLTAARILELLSQEARVNERGARLFVEQAIDLLCTHLVRRHSSITASLPVPRCSLSAWHVRRVTAFMRDNVARDIGLDELADLVHLSRFHFCTAFRLATGQTPFQCLTNERIGKARALLAHPGLRIGDIALMVGYQTPSAFAATFRRLVGVTPTEFRRHL
jgi:AraC family transcriptional regulator